MKLQGLRSFQKSTQGRSAQCTSGSNQLALPASNKDSQNITIVRTESGCPSARQIFRQELTDPRWIGRTMMGSKWYHRLFSTRLPPEKQSVQEFSNHEKRFSACHLRGRYNCESLRDTESFRRLVANQEVEADPKQ